jgi:hypothetical protein
MNTQLLTSPVKFLLIIVGLTTISACASTVRLRVDGTRLPVSANTQPR